MEAFIGSIIMFGGNFAPRGWALCNGQILSISQNTALFSILGTTYGGDGVQTFALPNLQSRMPMHAGNGPGLSPRTIGQTGGAETTTLTINNLPAHNHLINVKSDTGNSNTPTNNNPAGDADATATPFANKADSTMAASTVSMTGGSQPVATESPFVVVNFIIALQGIFPSRN